MGYPAVWRLESIEFFESISGECIQKPHSFIAAQHGFLDVHLVLLVFIHELVVEDRVAIVAKFVLYVNKKALAERGLRVNLLYFITQPILW